MKTNRILASAFLAGSLALCPTQAEAQQVPERQAAPPVVMNSTTTLNLAQVVQHYTYQEGTWERSRIDRFYYDDLGQILNLVTRSFGTGDTVLYYMYQREYNPHGELSQELTYTSVDSIVWKPQILFTRQYDPFVHDVRTTQQMYQWNPGTQKWDYKQNDPYNFYWEIERDSQDRVLEDHMWNNVEKDERYLGHSYSYHADGYAQEATFYSQGIPCYLFENMKWHQTNNQFLKVSNNVYWAYTYDAFNQPSYYEVYLLEPTGEKNRLEGIVSIDYDNQDRKISSLLQLGDTDKSTYSTTIQYDQDGKYNEQYHSVNWFDANANKVWDEGEELISRQYREVNYDEHHQVESSYLYDVDVRGTYTLDRGEVYRLQYDEKGNLMESVRYTYAPETDSYLPSERVVYSEFVEITTGLEDTELQQFHFTYADNQLRFQTDGPVHYAIYDTCGQLCTQGTSDNSVIHLRTLPQGLYFVHITVGTSHKTIKVVRS